MDNMTTIVALIVIAIICAAFMAWHHFERAAEKMTMPEPKTPAPDEDRQAREDHRARLAAYNDTEHQTFVLTPEQERQAHGRLAVQKALEAARLAQEQIDRRKEWKRQAEIRQHNSTFRALGMTPVPVYVEDPSIEWEKDFQNALETGWQEERERMLSGKPGVPL